MPCRVHPGGALVAWDVGHREAMQEGRRWV